MISVPLDIDHSLLCHVPDHGNPTAVLKSALFVQLAETQPIRYYGAKMMRFPRRSLRLMIRRGGRQGRR